ncbi:MAG: glycosyltransferase [Alphaproteobacteria bacterium]
MVVVDDGSTDGTAMAAGSAPGRTVGLTIVRAAPRPRGWTGKTWAMAEGLAAARLSAPDARYVWLTDADVVHGPDVLAGLVARAEAGGYDLVSLMVRLRAATLAERLLIPAYVFFFQMLYPFAWVRDPGRTTAAAAGGCMLVRRAALERIGGMAAIADAVIDDCALARAIKPGGPIWLGLAGDSTSLRGYPRAADVWRLIARSAYTELGHAPARLVLAVIGMGIVYLAPPALAVAADGWARVLGAAAWLLMAATSAPTLARFGVARGFAVALPIVALFYVAATIDSARRFAAGRGGAWKGRYQAHTRP